MREPDSNWRGLSAPGYEPGKLPTTHYRAIEIKSNTIVSERLTCEAHPWVDFIDFVSFHVTFKLALKGPFIPKTRMDHYIRNWVIGV